MRFNGVSAATFTVNSPTSIQATLPAVATTGPISVTTPAGTGTSSTAFKVATRFENTDPPLTYTSGWDRNSTSRPWSGGTAALASTAGQQVTFTFIGTDLRWIGFRGPQAGIARVSLDGVFIQQIDMYSVAEEVQAEVFKATGLASGNHTLLIEVTGTSNPASTGTYVVVDAFDVAPQVPATVNITSPPSGATVSGTIMITVTVSGDTVAGVRYRLDGANLGTEVTAPPYSLSWDTTTTTTASHTLSAVARLATGSTVSSSPVTVTVSNGPPGQTRFEDADTSIRYTAGWTRDSTTRAWSGGTAMLSTTAGDRATFTFTGNLASWIGFRGPQGGIARVYVDGLVVSDIDTYSSFEQVQAMVFQTTGLADGTHTLTIEVTGTSNPASTDTFIVVDAFDDGEASPVLMENLQPGSANWQMWLNGYRNADDVHKQIKGYASATSVNKGGSITFYVTVNPAQTYTIDLYRMGWYQGLGGRLLQHIGPLTGMPQFPCPVDAQTGLIECPWTASYVLTVPTTWTSGVFLAQVTNAQGYQNYIPFVVRDDARHSDILYQQSIATYQAYNNFPNDGTGKSLYEFNSFGANTVAGSPRAVKVSFNRPYLLDGSGDNFFRWEYYFIRWLERSGYDVTYSTDVDTHQNSSRLLNSKAFLSVGHDEYWSKEMYDAVERARDARVHRRDGPIRR